MGHAEERPDVLARSEDREALVGGEIRSRRARRVRAGREPEERIVQHGQGSP